MSELDRVLKEQARLEAEAAYCEQALEDAKTELQESLAAINEEQRIKNESLYKEYELGMEALATAAEEDRASEALEIEGIEEDRQTSPTSPFNNNDAF